MVRWTHLPNYVSELVEGSPGSVLLQTSRFDSSNAHSYLFLNPMRTISADRLEEIPGLFSRIEEALAQGLYAAGFLGYECGYHFEKFHQLALTPQALPLAWFGVYEHPFVFDHKRGGFQGPIPPPPGNRPGGSPVESRDDSPVNAPVQRPPTRIVDRVTLSVSEDDYRSAVLKIKEYIASGDTYQVNFTDRVLFDAPFLVADAFRTLSMHQPVAYSALLNAAGHFIYSLSPELFFRLEEGRIVTRPMKGTMPRGLDSFEDGQASVRLRNDEKNRSEHVMIVDLLRNDLGRICAVGSVKVDDIFSVERFPTLFQMTSSISGTLRPGLRYYDVFKSLFPSGSVTGAPKIRTMEIIHEMERAPRGIYTGTIGFMAPGGSATFNVAIRTLVGKGGIAHMGVGGGIVADSTPEDEYRECLLKAYFLSQTQRDFQLIETLLWDGHFHFLGLHLDRLESSAAYFDFPFERDTVMAQLECASTGFRPGSRFRLRVLVDGEGQATVSTTELTDERSTGYVKVSSERTSSRDVFLRHKTTNRALYDREYSKATAEEFDEVIFMNEKGEVTEGAISNLFVQKDGRLLTPPLRCGVLPGIFRRHLLETRPSAEERVLTLEDLESSESVFICNSVRGIRQVRRLCFQAALKEEGGGGGKGHETVFTVKGAARNLG